MEDLYIVVYTFRVHLIRMSTVDINSNSLCCPYHQQIHTDWFILTSTQIHLDSSLS